MGSKKDSKSAMKEVFEYWIWKQPMLLKVFLAVMALVLSFTAMKLILKDNNHFFIASELTHATGIVALIYKLTTKRTCSGLSLKSQELTAMFLAVRVVCSFMLEGDIHTLLDLATFVFTAWLIFMIRSNLKSTYIKDLDNFPLYSMVVPCAILAVLIHPRGSDMYISRLLWAFCVYLEAVSVTPQLRMMQNAKMIEPVTAHYVFALGVARFLSCANWIIQVYETGGTYLFLVGYGYLWFPMAILAEIVQTFILVDFCYYYIKRIIECLNRTVEIRGDKEISHHVSVYWNKCSESAYAIIAVSDSSPALHAYMPRVIPLLLISFLSDLHQF